MTTESVGKKRWLWLELFGQFFLIGAVTIGGGYVMLPLIERNMVWRRKWLKEEEFFDIVALAQASPGVFAINTAMATGYRLTGLAGALAAALGAALPSFLTILLVAFFWMNIEHHPVVQAVLRGVRPAVVALLVYAAVNMARETAATWDKWVLVGGAVFALLLVGLHPALAILASAIVGAIIWPRQVDRSRN